MSGYLRRYVGTYEVRADYDEDTNDFPRLIDGSLDPSFDDYYIKCANGIKIRHAAGSTLSCYIPSVKRGMNILDGLKDVAIEPEILDGEVYFTFPASEVDRVAKLCKVCTKGKNIQPLSPKTLPKRKSILPDTEMKRYKKICEKFDGEKIKLARVVLDTNKEFAERLPKDYKKTMKTSRLDFRNYLYDIGKWDEYVAFLEERICG